MSRPFVRVVGVALTVSACQKNPPEISANPPPPEATTPVNQGPVQPIEVIEPAPLSPSDIGRTNNPPAPERLPTWDEVVSGHPKGATNPPSPVLVVSRSPEACFKDWSPGMVAPPPDVMAVGGRVVEMPSEATGTQVVCPDGQPATLIAAYDAWKKKEKPL